MLDNGVNWHILVYVMSNKSNPNQNRIKSQPEGVGQLHPTANAHDTARSASSPKKHGGNVMSKAEAVITVWIGTGMKSAQYTLHCRRFYPNKPTNPHHTQAEHTYVKNLGTNREWAVKEATAYLESFRKFEKYLLVDDIDANFDLNKYNDLTVWQHHAIQTIKYSDLFPFGKHKGYVISKAEPKTIMWWAEQEPRDEVGRALINRCIEIADERELFFIHNLICKGLQVEKAMEPESDYIGTVGERIKFSGDVVFFKGFETAYGWSSITKIKDPDGNLIVYFGTAELGAVGDSVEFMAKVKKHEEYQDDKQTTVQRPTKIKNKSGHEEYQPDDAHSDDAHYNENPESLTSAF